MRDRIIGIRKEHHLSQEAFAERLNLSRNFINQFENGNKNMSDRTIRDICNEFSLNEEWLRTGKGKKEKDIDINFSDLCAAIAVHDKKARDAITKYYQLTPEDKKLFWDFMERFMK